MALNYVCHHNRDNWEVDQGVNLLVAADEIQVFTSNDKRNDNTLSMLSRAR